MEPITKDKYQVALSDQVYRSAFDSTLERNQRKYINKMEMGRRDAYRLAIATKVGRLFILPSTFMSRNPPKENKNKDFWGQCSSPLETTGIGMSTTGNGSLDSDIPIRPTTSHSTRPNSSPEIESQSTRLVCEAVNESQATAGSRRVRNSKWDIPEDPEVKSLWLAHKRAKLETLQLHNSLLGLQVHNSSLTTPPPLDSVPTFPTFPTLYTISNLRPSRNPLDVYIKWV